MSGANDLVNPPQGVIYPGLGVSEVAVAGPGLTKLEFFSVLIFSVEDLDNEESLKQKAKKSVKAAKILLEQIAKENAEATP